MSKKIITNASLLASGAVLGVFISYYVFQRQRESSQSSAPEERICNHSNCKQCLSDAEHRRDRLPKYIIFVRHGESEGNADNTLYRTKPDNLVELTKRGLRQAQEAGKRVEDIFKKADRANSGFCSRESAIKRVHLAVSPFERTRRTAAAMRPWFEHRIVRTDVQPRLREQEFGNLQGHDFEDFREEQKKVGRFWYRFPTGESGADVYDRVKSWWFDSVLNVNERVGYEPIDALVVVTHGLTMRFALMQLFGWSPTTFHSVWNADNCDMHVLQKDLTKPGLSPYVLDEKSGDVPKSSIDLLVEFSSQPGNRVSYKLDDYLRIPPPRTMQLERVKEMLAEQYPEIDKNDIRRVVFMPFIDGDIVEKRVKCGKRCLQRKQQMESPRKSPKSLGRAFSHPEEGWSSFHQPEEPAM